MKGIIWHLKGEYASFRPFYMSSLIDTYLFPPKTVVIGMIGAACGWDESDLVEHYDKIKVGIKIEHFDSIFNDLIKIWKVEDSGGRKIFVVVKRFLYKPEFTIYITASEDLLDTIQGGLEDPAYPITLGDSDSLFYPKKNYLKVVDIVSTKSRYFKCLINAEIVGGMHYPKEKREEGRFRIDPKIVKMPVSFEEGRKVKIANVLIHSKGEVELKEEVDAYEFEGEPIYLF